MNKTLRSLGLVALLGMLNAGAAAPSDVAVARTKPDRLRQRLMELQNRWMELDAELFLVGTQIAQAEQTIADIEAALAQIRDRRSFYALYGELVEAQARLDALLTLRDDLIAELVGVLTEIAQVQAQLAGLRPENPPGDSTDR